MACETEPALNNNCLIADKKFADKVTFLTVCSAGLLQLLLNSLELQMLVMKTEIIFRILLQEVQVANALSSCYSKQFRMSNKRWIRLKS